MKSLHSIQTWLRTGVGFAVIAAMLFAALSATLTASDTNAPPAKVDGSKKTKTPEKKLTGADLYAINCNRCHPERYPTEWNPAQWKTIMMHMRVRANLPAKQAKEILKYLQEDAGN